MVTSGCSSGRNFSKFQGFVRASFQVLVEGGIGVRFSLMPLIETARTDRLKDGSLLRNLTALCKAYHYVMTSVTWLKVIAPTVVLRTVWIRRPPPGTSV